MSCHHQDVRENMREAEKLERFLAGDNESKVEFIPESATQNDPQWLEDPVENQEGHAF